MKSSGTSLACLFWLGVVEESCTNHYKVNGFIMNEFQWLSTANQTFAIIYSNLAFSCFVDYFLLSLHFLLSVFLSRITVKEGVFEIHDFLQKAPIALMIALNFPPIKLDSTVQCSTVLVHRASCCLHNILWLLKVQTQTLWHTRRIKQLWKSKRRQWTV